MWMGRDLNASRQGYSDWSYGKVLDEERFPQKHREPVYQRDDSCVHTAKETVTWFLVHACYFIDPPPFSPYLKLLRPFGTF